MKLLDVMPVEKWVEIEKDIHEISGLNAAVYDAGGLRITDYKNWANRLCPAIKKTEKGQKYICAVAHQNIAAQALKTGQTIVAECDAGLMKFAVPIFAGDEFLGVAGGCGLLRDQEKIDAYLVHRTTEMDEKEASSLSEEIDIIPEDRLQSAINYLEHKLSEITR